MVAMLCNDAVYGCKANPNMGGARHLSPKRDTTTQTFVDEGAEGRERTGKERT
jgi:hypothetical protein